MSKLGDLDENLVLLRTNCDIPLWQYHKHKNHSGRLNIFTKRVIQKLTRFLIAPIVTTQSENNRLITASLEDIMLSVDELCEHISECERRIQLLENENTKLRESLNAE